MAIQKYAAAVLLAGVSTLAHAMDDFPMVDWGPMIQTEAMNSVIEDIGRSEAKRAGIPYPNDRKARRGGTVQASLSQGLASQVSGQGAATKAVAAAGYAPTAAVRKKLAGIMGDAFAGQDPAAAEEMRQVVLSGRAVSEYERIAPNLGLRRNDAIDAYAFYLLAQWGAANDYRPDVTRAQVAGVRRQAASAYAGIASQLGTDALRQEFAEMLIVQGVVMAGVHETAVRSGDEAAVKRHSAVARRGGENVFSMDPARIALTDVGFRAK
jgi:hypothetical protein